MYPFFWLIVVFQLPLEHIPNKLHAFIAVIKKFMFLISMFGFRASLPNRLEDYALVIALTQ
jgi:hypothetical protein